MLRVGLTGDLGSGKSTVGRMLAARGAVVLSADDIARTMMQPGEPVYTKIVEHFGPGVVMPDATLDRKELSRLAFDGGRVEELNALVHPAVLAEQARLASQLEHERPDAILVVESALIFTTPHGMDGQPWRERFDRVLMVMATEATKIARFVQRASAGRALGATELAALKHDARRRLLTQAPSHAFAAECLVIQNDGDLDELQSAVDAAWLKLTAKASVQSS